MKKRLIICCSFFFCTVAMAQMKSDLAKENLKGNVKTIVSSAFHEATQGLVRKDTVFETTTYQYNEKGFLTRKVIDNKDHYFDTEESYKYDSKGYLSELTTKFPKHVKDNNHYKYKYDAKGMMTESCSYDLNDSVIYKTSYVYDANGNVIESAGFTDGEKQGKRTYKYDEKGLLIEDFDHFTDGSNANQYSYKYDEKGNKTDLTFNPNTGEKPLKTNYKYFTYDSQGNWTKQVSYRNLKILVITKREIFYY